MHIQQICMQFIKDDILYCSRLKSFNVSGLLFSVITPHQYCRNNEEFFEMRATNQIHITDDKKGSKDQSYVAISIR